VRRSRVNRNRIDIADQILGAANGSSGTRKIKMMYQANLSYAQLKKYLMVLTERDLLRYDLDTQTFKTTEKGHKFLETYNQLDELMNPIEYVQV
jgi:predicted transcriptional regulator